MLLICMSAAGTIPLLVCLLAWLIMKQRFSYHFGKFLLQVSMVCYLTPVQLIKYLLPQQIIERIRSVGSDGYYINIQTAASVRIGNQTLWLPSHGIYIIAIWFLVILIFTLNEIIRYTVRIRHLKKSSYSRTVRIPSAGEFDIRVMKHIHEAYAVGFLHPFIVFPEKLLENPCAEMILEHEYAHLKNRDSLMKLICLGILCIHWINPLSILLLIVYSKICEFIADERATAGYTRDQKKAYFKTIIDLSTKSSDMPVVWKNDLFGSELMIRRRMEYIMKRKTSSKIRKFITACVAGATIAASSLTIFAYSPLQATLGENRDEFISGQSFGEFVSDDQSVASISSGLDTFIADHGAEYQISGTEVSPQVICIHNFEHGTYRKHTLNGSGGCTIYVYDARRCTKCGALEINELINKITYAKCIH